MSVFFYCSHFVICILFFVFVFHFIHIYPYLYIFVRVCCSKCIYLYHKSLIVLLKLCALLFFLHISIYTMLNITPVYNVHHFWGLTHQILSAIKSISFYGGKKIESFSSGCFVFHYNYVNQKIFKSMQQSNPIAFNPLATIGIAFSSLIKAISCCKCMLHRPWNDLLSIQKIAYLTNASNSFLFTLQIIQKFIITSYLSHFFFFFFLV